MRPQRAALYWVVVAGLVGFGILAILSVGFPFLVTGLALAILAPLRRRPEAFWPPLAGVLAFLAGAILVAPLGCRLEATPALPGGAAPGPGRTECASILGPEYAGGPGYHPPYAPALLAGVGAGLAAGGAAWTMGRKRGTARGP